MKRCVNEGFNYCRFVRYGPEWEVAWRSQINWPFKLKINRP